MSSSVLVTGGSGFLGRHVVREILSSGQRVRVLGRSADPVPGVEGVEVEVGSVLDAGAVARAMDGCDFVVHLAGRVSRDPRDATALRELHVEGTSRIVEGAAAAGVQRIVYASTSGTLACWDQPEPIATEDRPLRCRALGRWPYYVTKKAAEEVALGLASELGVELISINPSLLLGPGDTRGSSTGDVTRVLDGRVPALPSGGLSLVDVRDVAATMVAALGRGRPGETYLVGAVNWSIATFLRRVGELAGVPVTSMQAPDLVTRWAARVVEPMARMMGKPPPLDVATVEMSQVFWYCDSAKARSELGFDPRAPNQTLLDTIADCRLRRPR